MGQLDGVPDGYKVLIPTFSNMENQLEAAAEFCRAEILYAFSISMLGAAVLPEGNDEDWAMQQKADPELAEAFRNSLLLTIGGHSRRELEYREKCALAFTKKWDGRFLPQFNEPRALARAFIDIIWSIGSTSLRIAGDMLPSSSSPDGSPAMLKQLALLEAEIMESYDQTGAFYHRGKRGVTWRPEENLSIGAQGISTATYDPYDPMSLNAARQFIDGLFDPRSEFQRFGIPSRGGCLQIESVTHVHQNWGHLYDNYDVWLRKIKKMLDPNSVADWSAYIPPDYPRYPKDGNYVKPSYPIKKTESEQP